jgi:hypothetical protein
MKRYGVVATVILIACLFAAEAVSGGGNDAGKPAGSARSATAHASAEDAIAAFRGGWQSWMDALDRARPGNERGYSPRLSQLLDDVRPAMAWGVLQSDNRMIARSSGSLAGVWAMVIAPDHDWLSMPGPTLANRITDGLNVIHIRPDKVTERWAGILLVHEMSHALDVRQAPHKQGCSVEFDAYRVEAEALSVVLDGKWEEVLDTVVAQQEFSSHERLLASVENGRIARAIGEIERRLAEPSPLSAAEREMRDGFYVVSLIDRIQEREGADISVRCEVMAQVISEISLY